MSKIFLKSFVFDKEFFISFDIPQSKRNLYEKRTIGDWDAINIRHFSRSDRPTLV